MNDRIFGADTGLNLVSRGGGQDVSLSVAFKPLR